MRNTYEVAEVLEIGNAPSLILGQKPAANQVDSVLGVGFQTIPDMEDMDETDE